MADIIIVGVLAVIVFFVLRGELRKLRRGQCSGGCSGCAGCSAGCPCCSPAGHAKKKTEI